MLIYRQGGAFVVGGLVARAVRPSTIEYLDITGNSQALITEQGLYSVPRVSSDGKRLLVNMGDERGQSDVFVYDLQRDNLRMRLTTDGGHSIAIWGPHSRYVIFDSTNGLSWVRADGSSPAPLPLIEDTNHPTPWSFVDKTNRLGYESGFHLWTVPVEEQDGQLKANKPEQFMDKLSAVLPALSPDGEWLAYQSCPQCIVAPRGRGSLGQSEVIVRPFPPPTSGQSGQVQISNIGGSAPHWSQNNDLFYRLRDQVMAMSYNVTGSEFVPGKARVWAANVPAQNLDWDVTSDGKRLIVITPVKANQETEESRQPIHTVVLLQNFFDELRRRAPVR
jgi:hypothetical protein